MANYIVSYDLNGPVPTHAQIDKHMRSSGAAKVGRVLETVWYLTTPSDLDAVFAYVNRILGINDRVLVVEASNMKMRNLLASNAAIQAAWAEAA